MSVSHGISSTVVPIITSSSCVNEEAPVHSKVVESNLSQQATGLSKKAIFGTTGLMVAAVVGLFLMGSLPKQQRARLLAAESNRIKTALPKVRTILPQHAPRISIVSLPGDAQAIEETTLYPRTTGYVKRLLVDIGDEVKAGQLIAEIDTPDVKAQLQQSEAALLESKATLERTKATVNLARITNNRTKGLVARKSTAQQELDDSENKLAEAIATLRLNEATIASTQARVQQMREQMSFAEVRSPFAGTVVGRYIDTGKLVTAGNGTGQALFQLARTNVARVYVNVPQAFAPGVSVGLKATISTREMPGRKFLGIVKRTPRAIDPVTRTLLTEIHVPNDDRALLTGSYVQVRMEIERPNQPLRVPSTALIFNAAGTRLAVVGADGKVQLRVIDIAEDFGSEIGIGSGVSASDQIVVNPGDRMSEGLAVDIEQPAATVEANSK